MDIIINVIIIEYAIFFIITIAVVSVTTICSAVRYFPTQIFNTSDYQCFTY